MRLDCIVTLANRAVRLRFLAMERSLRAVGCDLPLKVIPYDDARFDLPARAEWWELPEITRWLTRERAHPLMRKYQCLTLAGYQFVDADVCFLRDPAAVLAPLTGFVTSCGHWHNPAEATTAESRAWFAARSSTWQKTVFNTGQFACDRALYDFATLQARAQSAEFASTCLRLPFHEQPGINLLVHAAGVPVQNLTLPPWNQQSTWAGDYPGEYARYWKTEPETPYLIHWAGVPMHIERP
ncbi:MAG TPA: hypothetical protein VGE76_05245, partial [Opitutaceae bacterium]